MIQNIFANTHARATPPPRYIHTCALHRFTHFKCKPLCRVFVDTVLVTIKRGLNDSFTDKIIVLIESVNLSLVCYILLFFPCFLTGTLLPALYADGNSSYHTLGTFLCS